MKLKVQFFEAVSKSEEGDTDYGGCYGFYKGLHDIDAEDILGQVEWIVCSKCSFHLGDDQYDKFSALLDEKLAAERD